jgi:hypothetical protein
MGKDKTTAADIGHGPVPSPRTAEDAALQYFMDRATLGDYAYRFAIERWSPDQRERFEVELARLEAKHEADRAERRRQLDAEGV